MRKASKPPSEWLKLLCRDWAIENIDIVEGTDLKFLSYKTYLKGKLTSQLLCRVSIPELGKEHDMNTNSIDFWKILGIHDEFDIRHIISEVERFCSLYSIRNSLVDTSILDETGLDAATAGLTVSPLHNFLGPGLDMTKASPIRREPRRLPLTDRRDTKQNDDRKRDGEPTSKEATREEKRHKKLLHRQQREQFAKQQKEAALRRAADLVRSNRIPIEITRGASVAKSVQKAVNVKFGEDEEHKSSSKKSRSDIIVSTASDLNQIVQHAKNLFYKYNTIAREHNKKVSWAMISKELGIHVKVREKYSRMHSRALQRNFDFQKYGHYKIKNHPEIFLEPLSKKTSEATNTNLHMNTCTVENLPTNLLHQPLHHDHSEPDVLHESHSHDHEVVHPTPLHHTDHTMSSVAHMHNEEVHAPSGVHHDHLPMYSRDMSQHITDDQVAAAVDAAIKIVPVNQPTDYTAEAAEAALTAGTISLEV